MEIDKDKIKYLTAVRLLYLIINDPNSCKNIEMTQMITISVLDTLFDKGIFERLSEEEENVATEYTKQVNKIIQTFRSIIEKEEGNA